MASAAVSEDARAVTQVRAANRAPFAGEKPVVAIGEALRDRRRRWIQRRIECHRACGHVPRKVMLA